LKTRLTEPLSPSMQTPDNTRQKGRRLSVARASHLQIRFMKRNNALTKPDQGVIHISVA